MEIKLTGIERKTKEVKFIGQKLEVSFEYFFEKIKKDLKLKKEDIKNLIELYILLSDERFFLGNVVNISAEEFSQEVEKHMKTTINSVLKTMEKLDNVRVVFENEKRSISYRLIPPYNLAYNSVDNQLLWMEISTSCTALDEGFGKRIITTEE